MFKKGKKKRKVLHKNVKHISRNSKKVMTASKTDRRVNK